MGDTADAVVIGAGVIGCSVADALARHGWRVTVVDRNPGPGQGSTSASSAIIRYHYSTLAGVATAWESHYAWQEWQDFLGGPDDDGTVARFWRTGAVCLDAPVQDKQAVLGLFDQVGVPYQELSAAEVRERFPWLEPARYYPPTPVESDAFWEDPEGEIGAYLTPDAGFVDDPSYAAHNLATAARRRGVTFRFRAPVAGIDRTGGRVRGVLLADGSRIDAPVVVNVAGPHSGAINALAGIGADAGIGTRPLRVEVHHVPAPDSYGTAGHPGPLVADLDLGTYFRGTPSGEVTIGGAEPECDPLEWIPDPDQWAPGVSQEQYRTQVYRVARRVPDLTVPNQPHGIAGVYDVSDDWIPVYDRTSLPGYYVAIGTSGNQFKNAPLVGAYLHAIIDACENGADHDTTPVSFPLPHCGVDLDLSAFSRRRERSTASSNTVMG